MSRHAGIRDALAPGAAHGVTLRGSDPQATRLMCSQGQLVWVIMYNIWPKVRVLTPYDNLSNPVVMTEGARGGGICTRAACPCILPLSRPCVTLSCLLIGRRHEIVLHHSRGKCLGTPLPSVRGDGIAERFPGGAAGEPAECKICRGRRIPIGPELNMTDSEQQ